MRNGVKEREGGIGQPSRIQSVHRIVWSNRKGCPSRIHSSGFLSTNGQQPPCQTSGCKDTSQLSTVCHRDLRLTAQQEKLSPLPCSDPSQKRACPPRSKEGVTYIPTLRCRLLNLRSAGVMTGRTGVGQTFSSAPSSAVAAAAADEAALLEATKREPEVASEEAPTSVGRRSADDGRRVDARRAEAEGEAAKSRAGRRRREREAMMDLFEEKRREREEGRVVVDAYTLKESGGSPLEKSGDGEGPLHRRVSLVGRGAGTATGRTRQPPLASTRAPGVSL